MPVAGDVMVFILCRWEKEECRELYASSCRADVLRWKHLGSRGDVVGYQVDDREAEVPCPVP